MHTDSTFATLAGQGDNPGMSNLIYALSITRRDCKLPMWRRLDDNFDPEALDIDEVNDMLVEWWEGCD